MHTFWDVAVANDGIQTLKTECHVRREVCDDADVADEGDQAADDVRVEVSRVVVDHVQHDAHELGVDGATVFVQQNYPKQ